MKRMSLKREIGNILESSAYLKESKTKYGEDVSVYQAESGNFKCSFVVSEKYPLEEAVEDLKKKAERIFRKPSAKIDRALNSQNALLYISEHREVIPLVKFLREKCGSARHNVADTMKSWVEKYAKKYGSIPPYVKPYHYPGFAKLYYCFKDNQSPESLYEVADIIPKAWIPD